MCVIYIVCGIIWHWNTFDPQRYCKQTEKSLNDNCDYKLSAAPFLELDSFCIHYTIMFILYFVVIGHNWISRNKKLKNEIRPLSLCEIIKDEFICCNRSTLVILPVVVDNNTDNKNSETKNSKNNKQQNMIKKTDKEESTTKSALELPDLDDISIENDDKKEHRVAVTDDDLDTLNMENNKSIVSYTNCHKTALSMSHLQVSLGGINDEGIITDCRRNSPTIQKLKNSPIHKKTRTFHQQQDSGANSPNLLPVFVK